jgi:hypothetical protein
VYIHTRAEAATPSRHRGFCFTFLIPQCVVSEHLTSWFLDKRDCRIALFRRDVRIWFSRRLVPGKSVTTYLAKMDYYRQILAHKVRSQLQPGYSGHPWDGKIALFRRGAGI